MPAADKRVWITELSRHYCAARAAIVADIERQYWAEIEAELVERQAGK